MKIMPVPANHENLLSDPNVACFSWDWQDTPHAVLEAVDTLLRTHSLEIVQYDAQPYMFRIEKIDDNEK